MVKLIQESSLILNVDNVVCAYIDLKEEEEDNYEGCSKIVIKTIGFNNNVNSFSITNDSKSCKNIIDKIVTTLPNQFISCNNDFCIRKDYFSLSYFSGENNIVITDIDGDLFIASKDVKDMKKIKKQLESNNIFNIT